MELKLTRNRTKLCVTFHMTDYLYFALTSARFTVMGTLVYAPHYHARSLVQHIRVSLASPRCLRLSIVRQGALTGISPESKIQDTGDAVSLQTAILLHEFRWKEQRIHVTNFHVKCFHANLRYK